MSAFYRWAFGAELVLTLFEFVWTLLMLWQHEWIRAFGGAGMTFGMGCMAFGVWVTGRTDLRPSPFPRGESYLELSALRNVAEMADVQRPRYHSRPICQCPDELCRALAQLARVRKEGPQ